MLIPTQTEVFVTVDALIQENVEVTPAAEPIVAAAVSPNREATVPVESITRIEIMPTEELAVNERT
ncbi:MAG: hypothetical protein ACPG8W_25720, partial [Candidatus Promineifilaceae bacterium]